MLKKLNKLVQAFIFTLLPSYILMFTAEIIRISLIIAIISFGSIFILLLIIAIRGSKKTNRTQTATTINPLLDAQAMGGVDQHHPPCDRFLEITAGEV